MSGVLLLNNASYPKTFLILPSTGLKEHGPCIEQCLLISNHMSMRYTLKIEYLLFSFAFAITCIIKQDIIILSLKPFRIKLYTILHVMSVICQLLFISVIEVGIS